MCVQATVSGFEMVSKLIDGFEEFFLENIFSFNLYPVRNNSPLGFELFDPALRGTHGPDYVEGSQRLEFLMG